MPGPISNKRVGPQALRQLFRPQQTLRDSTDAPAAVSPNVQGAIGRGQANNARVTPTNFLFVIYDRLTDVAGYYTAYVKWGSVSITDNADKRNGVLTLTLVGPKTAFNVVGTTMPIVENWVRFYYGSTGGYIFSGSIKTVTSRDITAGNVEIDLVVQDWTYLASSYVVDPTVATATRANGESDATRIAWLFGTWMSGVVNSITYVTTVSSIMPDQDFTGMTLAEAIDAICDLTGAVWYIDKDKYLHYLAPTGVMVSADKLSDAPDGITTFGYTNLRVPADTTEVKNRVVVIGMVTATYEDTASMALYGSFTGVIRDASLDATGVAAAGAAYLATYAYPPGNGSLTTLRQGYSAGDYVYVTSANNGLTLQPYRIATLEMSFLDKENPIYNLTFGTNPVRQLETAIVRIADTDNKVAGAIQTVLGHNVSFAANVAVAGTLIVTGATTLTTPLASPTFTGTTTMASIASGGTSFPGSPATNDRYYRSDLKMEFVYDGTRWLSTELFELALAQSPGSAALSASLAATLASAMPTPSGASDIYLVDLITQFFVNAGTALDGSNKWVMAFNKRPTGNTDTLVATVNVASGSSSVWRTDTTSINALQNNGTTHFVTSQAWTKTGTPGNLSYYGYFTYRIVAT